MEKALDIVKKQTGIDASKGTKNDAISALTDEKEDRKEGIEVGGAWPDKRFKDKLNIKDVRTKQWKSVNLNELEKIDNGYKHKTKEGVFIFRKLQKEERINNRMPWYRVYKIEEIIKDGKVGIGTKNSNNKKPMK